ncbi:MAG: MBL fold metallo-hydrolase [Candidatus Accumulibacter sp.]|jgi:metallo-beta-lactamase family protein|nr:MBL fold metallo-hydrolase [Accumulibacter sp.]
MTRFTFFGAAGEVTGSCTLVETDSARFLVDCGMFQGGSEARLKNLRALDFGGDVRGIDFVLLTHAHIDHSGLLPRLAVLGYRGPIYATPASIDLLGVLLPDSAHIQEKESEWQLRHQRRGKAYRGGVQTPLYSVTAAREALKLLRPAPCGETFRLPGGVEARFHDAGHILGSAWLEIVARGQTLVFSGDLGMRDRPVLRDPERPALEADALLVESTYGDRLHRPMEETIEEIVAAFERTRESRGNLVIPSFAVGRTQEILCLLGDLIRRGRLSPLQVFVDSPMANEATRITLAHPELLDDETHELIDWVKTHPDMMQVEFVADAERSRAINTIREGAVIISASGMCDAGRIKYHLRENLPRGECSVLIVGFQAGGTLGRRLVDGARVVRIFGEPVPVRARIHTVGGLSAHADQGDLLNWLGGFRRPPGKTFLVHGEAGATAAFARAIENRLGWKDIRLPQRGQHFEI